ncbi:hypothetical protein [Streptomyces erythrochromogenes]|uniref:hypothetical protein n=1 Tax=Streptomyces erythrochromogenes TaxID=285574 RepID=UPI003818454A
MSLPDWARLSGIPSEVITRRMNGHSLTLEAAMRTLGWTPQPAPVTPDLITVPLEQLQSGDLLLSIDAEHHTATVHRPQHPAAAATPPPTRPPIKPAAPSTHRR